MGFCLHSERNGGNWKSWHFAITKFLYPFLKKKKPQKIEKSIDIMFYIFPLYIYSITCLVYIFSSSELWAQGSYSDRLLSDVFLSLCKLFIFSYSSPEPPGQFQLNLAQSILGWRELKFILMKATPFFKGRW